MSPPLMEKRSVSKALDEAEFRLRPMQEPQLRAIVRAMLTMTRSGVLVTDLDHRALGCNFEFGRIFRCDPETVPQMDVEELRGYVYPRLPDPQAWVKNLDEVYADPLNTYCDEMELHNPHLWIRRNSTPLLSGEGEVMGRLWKFEDISEEKVRERRRQVVQRLSVFHDPDPAIVYKKISEEVAEFYGSTSILSIQDGDRMLFRAVARPIAGAEHIRENALKEAYCQLVLEEGRRVIVQDGRANPKVCDILPVKLGLVRYLGVPLLDSQGRAIGTLCILDSKHDEMLSLEDADFMAVMGNRISVELERERLFELRTREQRHALEIQTRELESTHAVLTAINRGLALVDEVGSESELMEREQGLLGELLDLGSVRLLTAESQSSLSRSWTQDKDSFCLEILEPAEEFSEAYLQTHLSALADQIALTFSAFRLKRELQQAQERLLQAEKLSVVGALAATVAHDIRNIMTSVALEADSTDAPEEALKRVRKQVSRFSVLSHRLLSYVKPKFVASEASDLNEVVRRAVELLEPQVRVSRVALRLELDPAVPCVVADPNQVEHLFVNLIVNALQAVSRADGELIVASRASAASLQFSVQDNGRGMTPERLAQIFDPFYSSRADGFGLGLFSCRRIAEEHGWRLEATSTPGRGSEFTLTIPRVEK